jgi:SAM-dependent methyltransferase
MHSSSDWAEKEESEHAFWKLECSGRLVAFLEILQKRMGKLLDVGCCGGWFLAYAKGRGWVVLGIESSQSRWMRTASCAPVLMGTFPGVEVSGNAPFEVAYVKLLMEQVPEPLDVLAAVREVLHPGGIVAVQVPNDFNPLQLAAPKLFQEDSWWVGDVSHDDVDRESHWRCMALEKNSAAAGLNQLRRAYSRWFLASQGIGREAFVFAAKA